MKTATLSWAIAILCSCHVAAHDFPVNSVLGDKSFIAAFGYLPDGGVSERVRIRTHLAYVELLLRNTNAKGLSPSEGRRRSRALDLLHEYNQKGVFPMNYDFPNQKRPCFIDRSGRICAVGYLIQQTAGNVVAEQINAKHQYDYITEMNDPIVFAWAKMNGLTVGECAMIQPQYNFYPSPAIHAPLKTGYATVSGIVGGYNSVSSVFNLLHIRGSRNKLLPAIGIATGAGEIIMGFANMRKTGVEYSPGGTPVKTTYRAQNNLSCVNIGLGAATIASSVLNMCLRRKYNARKSSLSVYTYPELVTRRPVAGLSFVRNI